MPDPNDASQMNPQAAPAVAGMTGGGGATALVPEGPSLVIDERSGSVWAALKGLCGSWELVYLLAKRDLAVRYRQTVVGIGWAVLNPLLMMLVLSVFFGMLGRIGPAGVPYPPFLLSGMVMWRLFESAVGRTSDSLVANTALIDKASFPRLVLPAASTLSPLVDFAISLLVLGGVMAYYGVVPLASAAWLPVFIVITMAAALGSGLWLAGLNAHYRDVGHMLQVVLRLGFYASPVLYPLDLVPQEYHLLYAVNPMVTIISQARHGLCGSYESVVAPTPEMWAVSMTVIVVVLISGLFVFNRLEKRIADVL